MSRIKEYKDHRRISNRIANDVCGVLGQDRSDNDKHAFRVTFLKLMEDKFSPMLMKIDAHYGYYGSSSCSSGSSEELGRFLAVAIQENAELLLNRAVELADARTEQLRQAAISEAQDVLKSVEDDE